MSADTSAGVSPGVNAAAWRQFVCRICGLIYDEARGDADSGLAPGTRFEDIPDDWACPICGVGKADFEPHLPLPAVLASTGRPSGSARPRAAVLVDPRADAGVLIVGAGRAGWEVARALRERAAALPITLLSACNGDVYDKPTLSVAVARGLSLDALVRECAGPAAARLGLRLLTDTHAITIDAARRRLRTTRGSLRYQHLVLAHGADPALPAALPARFVWRINDLASYRRLRGALAAGPQRLALIGAGLVGCELANDLALAGHAVTLLDLQPLPLAAVLPPEASQCLLQAWQGLPIRFRGGVQVAGVAAADHGEARWRVRLHDGDTLDVDHVIAATGLRTPGRLARSAGLLCDDAAGGIVVDADTGATSQPHIHALGDCVVVNGRAHRFIEPILRQARGIAQAIAGGAAGGPAEPSSTLPPPPILRIKTSSLPITLTGDWLAPGHWRPDPLGRALLRLKRVGAGGEQLAALVAGKAP